jgi:Sec-independent protein translocase protein TatA
MFGISWAEFFVVLLVGVLVIPARCWPDVARFLARLIKFVREFIWKITDATENIKNQIELEKPIDDLIKTTTDEMLDSFSVVKKSKKTTAKKTKRKEK